MVVVYTVCVCVATTTTKKKKKHTEEETLPPRINNKTHTVVGQVAVCVMWRRLCVDRSMIWPSAISSFDFFFLFKDRNRSIRRRRCQMWPKSQKFQRRARSTSSSFEFVRKKKEPEDPCCCFYSPPCVVVDAHTEFRRRMGIQSSTIELSIIDRSHEEVRSTAKERRRHRSTHAAESHHHHPAAEFLSLSLSLCLYAAAAGNCV